MLPGVVLGSGGATWVPDGVLRLALATTLIVVTAKLLFQPSSQPNLKGWTATNAAPAPGATPRSEPWMRSRAPRAPKASPPGPQLHRPSAVSKDMLVKWFQAFASEVLMDPVHELVGR